MRRSAAGLALLLGATAAAHADPAVAFRSAWAPAAEKGGDTTLFLTADNGAAEDAIVRVRCDAANFTELRTVDRGEGLPSTRVVKAIPLAANGPTALTGTGFNIQLLQLTRALAPGDTFECVLRLRGGTQQTVPIAVRPADAAE